MKAMTIGISPEYNYPGDFNKWKENNTYYASNHGASLITRSIMREFNADYIDDFSDLTALKNKYDTCIMALATHAHSRRDLSQYVNILEKLQVKVVIVSLGVEDYLGAVSEVYELHSSVKRLLNLALEDTQWIGVRGPYTATILQQNGFKDIVPIGCPTVYWNMKEEFDLNIKDTYDSPLVVYHRSIAQDNFNLIKDFKVMGQDFQDEAIFTKNLIDDVMLMNAESNIYSSMENSQDVLKHIDENGFFPNTFDEWFSMLSKSDFSFGPRLHGVIGSLIQGTPAVLTTRDLRTKEMAEVFNLPSIDHREIGTISFKDVVKRANFDKFKETYKVRYVNYLSFIKENKMDSSFIINNEKYEYIASDIQSFNYLNNIQIMSLKEQGLKNQVNNIRDYWRNLKINVKNYIT